MPLDRCLAAWLWYSSKFWKLKVKMKPYSIPSSPKIQEPEEEENVSRNIQVHIQRTNQSSLHTVDELFHRTGQTQRSVTKE